MREQFMDPAVTLQAFHTLTSEMHGEQVGKNSNGRILSASINGAEYTLIDKYTKNKTADGQYYFAMVYNNVVYIFPSEISKSVAEDIMRLSQEVNKDGRFSVYTYYEINAKNVASVLGVPMGPEIEGSENNGYLWHYHTTGHVTPAHAFFGEGHKSQ